MGVGVLIVFIAMLLVAAVAAGVLITTTGSLQQKALSTGTQTRGEISTHLTFVQVTGENGINGDLENFSAIVKLAAGSEAIDLSDALLTVALVNATSNLRYENNSNFSAVENASTKFSVNYQVRGADFLDGFISRGDIVTIYMNPPRNVTEDENVRLFFVPKIGTPSVLEFMTPQVISRQQVVMFP